MTTQSDTDTNSRGRGRAGLSAGFNLTCLKNSCASNYEELLVASSHGNDSEERRKIRQLADPLRIAGLE